MIPGRRLETGDWPEVVTPPVAAAKLRRSNVRLTLATKELRDSTKRLRADVVARCSARTSSRPAPDSPHGTAACGRDVEREGRGRVLLVEDDAVTARSAFRFLTRFDFVVECVSRGRDACRRLSEPWEAVVLDLDLGPGCNGVAVADEAHARRVEWSGRPDGGRVVLWSGAVDAKQLAEQQGLRHADACVLKSDSMLVLVRAIRPFAGADAGAGKHVT